MTELFRNLAEKGAFIMTMSFKVCTFCIKILL
jgi:hypothetical protein